MKRRKVALTTVRGILPATLMLAGCWLVSPLAAAAAGAADVRATHLRCEYRQDPVGIDVVQPRLSWTLETAPTVRGQAQSAYQVLVASSPEKLAGEQGDLWDSGKVSSDQQLQLLYGGVPLASRLRCYWKVRVWDQDSKSSGWSKPAMWSMGLLEPGDWQGRWIAATDQLATPAASGVAGFHALEAGKPDELKWVQVDLGAERVLDEVKLYPPAPSGFERVKGFGFPVRFRIEASNDPDFGESQTIADFSRTDYPSPGNESRAFFAHGIRGRYVRITATRLWNRKTGPEPFCFALAELEVLSKGTNVALGAPGRAKDSFEGAGWGLQKLTDGQRLPDTQTSTSNRPGNAAVLMRKEIRLDTRVTRATAFLCGLGYSELEINGRKIGDAVLDPGFTDFSRRVLYRTYDVTDAVRLGPNALGVILGGGWFNLATPDAFAFEHAPWSASPRMRCQLHLEFADGTTRTVTSDASWKWSVGAITFNCVRGGETIDAREDKPGWSLPGYDDSAWHAAMVVAPPAGKLVSQQHPAIRATTSIRPVKLTVPKPGVYVFDLGVNIAGWARLDTHGPRGTKVTLQSNELLNQDGTVNTGHNTSHTHGRFQTEEYILKGEGVETFEPRFTYHGFRYVQVSGLTEEPTVGSLTGRWVTTAPERVGHFTCSNERINKIQEVILRTLLNNMHGIPTDCPQREKMGWMDDGCVGMETAFYNLETPLFYRKWFHDMMDAQDPNGHVPDFVPTSGWGRSGPDGSPGAMADPWWGGAIVMTPWKLYLHYGDTRVLEEGYPSMKAYVDYLGATAKDHLIHWGLGDWLVGSAKASAPPQTHLSTAAYAWQARIVSQTAALLGKNDDARRYATLADQIRDAFNKRNLNPETGWYVSNSQSGQAVPLALGLVPENLRPQVLGRLVESITARNGHVGAGIVGLLPLFQALMENGRDDLAYLMLTREDFPGWLHMVNSGATSIWEVWNGDGSRNHPTLGCIGVWFYEGLGGIRLDPAAPAFKRLIIKPAVVGDLAWVKCSYSSVHGKIESHWRREGGKLRLEVTIPANTTATIYVPTAEPDAVSESGRSAAKSKGVKFLRAEKEAAVYEVRSGQYAFEAPFSTSVTSPP